MEKIGIITIFDNYNFGNRLQNYAVQEVLNKLKIDNETIINYNFDKNITYKLKSGIRYLSPKKDHRRLFKFINFNKNISFSKIVVYKNFKNFNYFENLYDVFVVGSDQVWNPKFISNKKLFLIDFLDSNNSISFAASFGIANIELEDYELYKKGLNKFKQISVREDSGKKIIEKLTGRKDVEVLVDPTMLLTSKEWDNVSKRPSKLKSKKYILNYFLGEFSEERKKCVEKFAKENSCDIVNLMDRKDPLYTCGPSEFLYLVKNAFLVCTDSFHGCVFSIIYNRPFVIFDREEKNMNNMGSRIDTLLDTFKLENRRYNGKNITSKNLNNDYNEAYKILEREKEKSLNFLKKALNIK